MRHQLLEKRDFLLKFICSFLQSDIIPTLSHIKSYFLSEQSKTTLKWLSENLNLINEGNQTTFTTTEKMRNSLKFVFKRGSVEFVSVFLLRCLIWNGPGVSLYRGSTVGKRKKKTSSC